MNERGEEERDIVINTIPIGNGQWNDEYRKENGTNSAGTTLAPAAQSAKTGRRQNGSIATENSNSSKNHYFTGHPSRLTLLYY